MKHPLIRQGIEKALQMHGPTPGRLLRSPLADPEALGKQTVTDRAEPQTACCSFERLAPKHSLSPLAKAAAGLIQQRGKDERFGLFFIIGLNARATY